VVDGGFVRVVLSLALLLCGMLGGVSECLVGVLWWGLLGFGGVVAEMVIAGSDVAEYVTSENYAK
jgi:hypothetical protein